jgi:hypothetical protein
MSALVAEAKKEGRNGRTAPAGCYADLDGLLSTLAVLRRRQ